METREINIIKRSNLRRADFCSCFYYGALAHSRLEQDTENWGFELIECYFQETEKPKELLIKIPKGG